MDNYTFLKDVDSNVSLIREIETGKYFAFKIFPFHPEVGLMNINEIDIMSRLDHPALLKCKQVIPYGQSIGLVLPLAKWTLSNAIKQNLLSDQEKVIIMWQLALGINFLHTNKILHLDLCSDNIILRGSNLKIKAIIADFASTHYGVSVTSLQQYGKSSYQAPEIRIIQENEQKYIYTQRCDVWSLGIIYLQILTGSSKINLLSPENLLCFLETVLPKQFIDASDLLVRMLDPNPQSRLELIDIFNSVFFSSRLDQEIPSQEVVTISSAQSNGTQLCSKLQDKSLLGPCLLISNKLYRNDIDIGEYQEIFGLDKEELFNLEKEIIISLDGHLII